MNDLIKQARHWESGGTIENPKALLRELIAKVEIGIDIDRRTGRKNNGDGYAWLPLICGIGMGCRAKVLVRRDLLEDIAQTSMDARR